MHNSPPSLPRWDLTTIYPSLVSPEFRQARDSLDADVTDLDALFDAHDISRMPSGLVDDETVAAFESIVARFNIAEQAFWELQDFVSAFVDTDVRDMHARAVASEFRPIAASVAGLRRRLLAWVGSLDVEALIRKSVVGRDHAYLLRRAQYHVAHTMSEPEEELAAALHVCGGSAWSQLHADLTASMTARVRRDGDERVLPMSAVRVMGADPDREIRQQAYEAEVAAWEATAVPLAAALNGVKGEASLLAARRGWANPLDAALFEQGIDRATLDALIGTTRETLVDFQRYLRAKALLLGLPTLAWYDLFAPIEAGHGWTFDTAEALVTEQFRAYTPALGNLAERAFRECWIDAEPRPGKRSGGLCLWMGDGISRIRLEFHPRYDSVRTLAHELGHAYHYLVLTREGRTSLQIMASPPPFMEMVSKFCEELVRRGALSRAEEQGDAGAQLALLDASLASARRSVVETLANFLFEDRFFALRSTRELGVDEINALMLQVQKETTGDVLDKAAPYPWSWAAQPHLYLNGTSFYNVPYLFGLLFALGLHARYRDNPTAFYPAFDDLLAATGMADPMMLAARFGIDLRSPDFWRAGLAGIRADIGHFEELVHQRADQNLIERRPHRQI